MPDDVRGTGTIASIPIPAEGPIYWSEEEVARLVRAGDRGHEHARALNIANEAVAILRERNPL
jgi:hypothetical protein